VPSDKTLTRRDALKKIAASGAGAAATVFWVDALVSAAEQHAAHYHAPAAAAVGPWTPKVLSPAQNEAVIALAEIIIPKTETPGATDARVNAFIDGVLSDTAEDNRKKFLDGLAWLDTHTTEAHGAPFTKLGHEQQVAVLTALSQLSPDASPVPPGADFFQAIKSLTVTGYYTSEIAMREEIGDDGLMFFAEFTGCTHKEHGAE
jgi:glucoside 3-dehydrogenase (cytochrome c) hitch-hiker subunit